MDNKFFDLQTTVEDVSFCELERARTACEELINDYFTDVIPNPHMLAFYYHKSSTMAHIVFDYIVRAQEKLDAETEAKP